MRERGPEQGPEEQQQPAVAASGPAEPEQGPEQEPEVAWRQPVLPEVGRQPRRWPAASDTLPGRGRGSAEVPRGASFPVGATCS